MTGEPSLGQAPAGQAAATVIPRGSARTAGIPAGDAASIRAAIPAGPSYRRSPAGAANSDPPAGIRPQPPPPRLQPRRGNAERDDDDNAARALTTPTRNPNPGARAAGRNAGFLASAPVIGITCLDCCRFGTPDDPRASGSFAKTGARDATGGFAIPGDDGSLLVDWDPD
jgi:hypothetical protein